MESAGPAIAATPPDFSREDAEHAFEAAVRVYVETRRTRIPQFVRRNFGIAGALRIHRVALGWDLVRAPANIGLAVPHLLKILTAAGLRRAGAVHIADRLLQMKTQIETEVEREVRWLLWTELLELPFVQAGRKSDRDALAEILMARPEVVRALTSASSDAGESAREPAFQARLAENLSRYTGARNAAAEIATALASAGAGSIAIQQLTPTAYSLGPPVAAAIAHQAAVFAFPLGAGLGGIWYAVFPPEPSTALIVGATAVLLAFSSVVAAFAGIFADPVQRLLGVHQRRLDHFVRAVGDDLAGQGKGAFKVRAHYIARLFDLFEAVRLAVRAGI